MIGQNKKKSENYKTCTHDWSLFLKNITAFNIKIKTEIKVSLVIVILAVYANDQLDSYKTSWLRSGIACKAILNMI